MKWTVYAIRHKDSKVGKDLFVGHFACDSSILRKTLKEVLRIHKQKAEERGRKNVAGFKLHRRMIEIGPENWKIVVLGSAMSGYGVRELEREARKILNADLNEWIRAR